MAAFVSATPRLSLLRRVAAGGLVPALLASLSAAIVAEIASHARDRGAFPRLNVYVADVDRGLRLKPGTDQRLATPGGPVTRVRINRDGFRGPDLPPAGAGEILVIGDGQVFGLGVDEDETFTHALTIRLPGRRARNLGVPTYGPLEYDAVLAEALERAPRTGEPPTVVYTVNLADDLLEASRPNRARRAVWQGWAVRPETAPPRVPDFPGRELLLRRSHAVFALRGLVHRSLETEPWGFASEVRIEDVVVDAARRTAAREAAREDRAALDAAEKEEERAPLRGPLASARDRCASRKARLLVVVLPLDVEVSASEWVKYGREPRDTRELRALADDVLATAAALGIETVDPREALAAAEPGAFSKGDGHLSPEGHRAVASALAAVVRAPASSGPEARR